MRSGSSPYSQPLRYWSLCEDITDPKLMSPALGDRAIGKSDSDTSFSKSSAHTMAQIYPTLAPVKNLENPVRLPIAIINYQIALFPII